MKNYFKESIKNIKDYFYDHPILKMTLEYIITTIATVISAFCFAYGFRSFISPGGEIPSLISGGGSGLAQVIVSILQILFHPAIEQHYLQSIFYFIVNIPLLIIAFFKIGKRFTIFSIINVILTSVFISIIPESWTKVFDILDDTIARCLFAGILTGLSSSIAIKFDHSAGGVDIISVYFSSKKQTSVGKYSLLLNSIIVLSYVFINGFQSHATMALYTIVYFFTSSMVINTLCLRNKKTELQIITSREELAKILIYNFPHGCTVVDGKGAYSNAEKKIIFTVLSYYEVKKAIKIIQEVDPQCFITVLNTDSVHGKFFMKPIK